MSSRDLALAASSWTLPTMNPQSRLPLFQDRQTLRTCQTVLHKCRFMTKSSLTMNSLVYQTFFVRQKFQEPRIGAFLPHRRQHATQHSRYVL